MFEEDYDKVCGMIIKQTMDLIKPEKMKRYPDVNKNDVKNGDVIYKSAAAGKAAIIIVDTPAGTGKSMLIKDRVNCLLKQNVAPEKIMILNLNIAKSKQMIKELPKGLQIMTFCEFTHNMFRENELDIGLSSEDALLNAIRMKDPDLDSDSKAFLQRLSIRDPKERNTMLSLFVNQHIDAVHNLLKQTNKISYMLEALMCQNQMYRFKKDPYNADAIIINGVHNMPVPILCSVIEYAYKRKANLFITGTTNETIYDFNMAYSNTINVLSSFSSKNVEIIRLTQSKIHKDISDAMDMKRTQGLERVKAKHVFLKESDDDPIKSAFSDSIIKYINMRLKRKEQILFLARSNSDIHRIREIIEENCSMENKTIIDLTDFQIPKTTYGEILSKNKKLIANRFPSIKRKKLKVILDALYDYEIRQAKSPKQRQIYEQDKKNTEQFVNNVFESLPDKKASYTANALINECIEYENDQWKKYMKQAEKTDPPDFSAADLIYSTIHSAIDIRSDHTIILFNDINEEKNKPLYHVALSRANESEYVIFLNSEKNTSQYYSYIKNNQK